MFNILIFMLCCLALVVSSWVASLECFKSIGCEDTLDVDPTAFDKRHDFSLENWCFLQCEYFSNVYIGEMLSAALLSWRLRHWAGSHITGKSGYLDNFSKNRFRHFGKTGKLDIFSRFAPVHFPIRPWLSGRQNQRLEIWIFFDLSCLWPEWRSIDGIQLWQRCL